MLTACFYEWDFSLKALALLRWKSNVISALFIDDLKNKWYAIFNYISLNCDMIVIK